MAPDPAAARPLSWPVAVAALLAGASMFLLSIIHNDFPFEYHPDEPSKVAQLVSGTRNYNHPPLMLTLTAWTTRLLGISPRAEHFARMGRTLSAAYLAGAVACLTIVAGWYGGTPGAAGAAVALGTNAQAVLAGHFFKEDALFTFGLALTFLAGEAYWRRRGRTRLLLLGAAAGLALSSKYVGALAVVYALALAALANDGEGEFHRRSWTNLGWCALGAAAVVGLCNGWALWEHFGQIRHGWVKGAETVGAGNQGVGAKVPHLQFVGMFFWFTPVPVLVGAGWFWVTLRDYPFRQHADRWLTGLSPLWLLAVFSFSASTAVRYFLPISLGLSCLAGIALSGGLRWAAARSCWVAKRCNARTASWAAAVFLLVFNLPGLFSLLGGFAGDDHAALGTWIAQRLPPDAVIAQDTLAQLPLRTLPQRVASVPAVADLGDVATLRARGITHVVVCWYDSRRYVDPRKHSSAGDHDFLRRREFYATLPMHARSLWKGDLRQPYPLRPGLELFALD